MELVMFDANALRNRDILEWAVFGQLRELMGAHALRVAVTEVVLAEVVANRQRDIDADLSEFNALAQNSVLRHLSGEDVTHARELATEEREELASSVRTALVASGVEILGYPTVDHEELVERAVNRRLPNKAQNGDGYRDTLNWFSILEEASKLAPEDELLWVTQDSDFGPRKGSELHEPLRDELQARGITCTVILKRAIDDAGTAARVGDI